MISDLKNGVRIEVEGVIVSKGVLQTEEVTIKKDSNIHIIAPVTEVTRTEGSIMLLGISISQDSLTAFEGDSEEA